MKPTPEKALPVYTVDEPACVPADRVAAVVTAPPVEPGDLEVLLRRYICLFSATYLSLLIMNKI